VYTAVRVFEAGFRGWGWFAEGACWKGATEQRGRNGYEVVAKACAGDDACQETGMADVKAVIAENRLVGSKRWDGLGERYRCVAARDISLHCRKYAAPEKLIIARHSTLAKDSEDYYFAE
jgi:hypothetical protein